MSTTAPFAVYTIVAERELDARAASGRTETFSEKKRWVRGEQLFAESREAGTQMLVVFADAAHDCSRLIYFGTLEDLSVTADGTTYKVRGLTKIEDHRTQELVLESTGKTIAEGYLRPYAIVRTPDFAKRPPTLFSFGYWGCGSATRELVGAIDRVERQRGFEPPLWVDIRVNRSVRAEGFRDNAFEQLLGARYWWLRDLGNQRVADGQGGIEIRRPEAVKELLEGVLAERSRRLIFFCSCGHPAGCHRHTVAKLAVTAARRRGVDLIVDEWPGGRAGERDLEIVAPVLRKLRAGAKRLPVPASMSLAEAAAIPWGTLARFAPDFARAIGPARFEAAGAFLPVLPLATARERDRWRREQGYDALRT